MSRLGDWLGRISVVGDRSAGTEADRDEAAPLSQDARDALSGPLAQARAHTWAKGLAEASGGTVTGHMGGTNVYARPADRDAGS